MYIVILKNYKMVPVDEEGFCQPKVKLITFLKVLGAGKAKAFWFSVLSRLSLYYICVRCFLCERM